MTATVLEPIGLCMALALYVAVGIALGLHAASGPALDLTDTIVTLAVACAVGRIVRALNSSVGTSINGARAWT